MCVACEPVKLQFPAKFAKGQQVVHLPQVAYGIQDITSQPATQRVILAARSCRSFARRSDCQTPGSSLPQVVTRVLCRIPAASL